jgi:hypothetical protein
LEEPVAACNFAPGNNMDDKLILEARAKIIWGESSSSVRAYLIANGISETDADAAIKVFNQERNAEIRRRGIKNILIGLPPVVASGVLLHLIYRSPSNGSFKIGAGKLVGLLCLAGFYGLWKLVNGIFNLFRPQSEEGSISDITE